ncbi:DUF4446 family protein [candidate division WWE3 bacterium]|nr:DUF4446 family protein [candidate division WWE3 bacterium]
MDSLIPFFISLSVFTVWLLLLTYLYLDSVRHYKNLSINRGESLDKAINLIFKGLEQLHNELGKEKARILDLEKAQVRNVQKVSLKRFNPFDDTGGNQSFTMAMLDANNDGVVFSSLHGRSGTRIYAKPIKSGMQADHELSEEEQEVVNLASKD